MSPRRRCVRLACTLPLLVRVATGAATDSPPPGNIWPAHPAALFDPASRCPQLQPTTPEDAAGALVVFEVSSSGHPSHAAVKSSSSDEQLDAAAVSCVMKLRFQPPTLLGEGTPIAAREQIAFKWAPPPARRNEAAAVAGQQGNVALAAGAATGVGASAAAAHVGTRSAELRVCVDVIGKLVQAPTLVHSSGDAAFDAAALSVARAGSGSYRAPASDGKAASGCLSLALTTDER